MIKIKIIIILIVLFLFTVPTCFAHKPVDVSGPATRSDPIEISDHKISWAAYNKLDEINEIDYYKFMVEKNEHIYSSLLVPKIDRLKDFNPTLVLIGPGLQRDDLLPSNINLDIKDNEGYIVIRYTEEESEVFFEPFTQTHYYIKQELNKIALEKGIYYLAVLNEQNRTGKYVLAIGKKEIWSANEIIKLPKTWWDVRMFMEKEKSTYAITVGLGLIIGFLIFNSIK